MFFIFLKIIEILVYRMIEMYMYISTCMSVFAFTLSIDAMPLYECFRLHPQYRCDAIVYFRLHPQYRCNVIMCFHLHPQHRCDVIVCFSVVTSGPKAERAHRKHESITSLHYTYVINHRLKQKV